MLTLPAIRFRYLAVVISLLLSSLAGAQPGISNADVERIGNRIWKNECAGTVEGLTSWNKGENFASLGIGHFIWYPAGVEGPFDESFPSLVAYLRQSGVQVPAWLVSTPDCPWPNRDAFMKDRASARMKELRSLLASTVPHQTRFIIARLNAAMPRFQAAAGAQAGKVMANVAALQQSAAGNFAMIDYVNFKGEGLKREESYNGQGWGLLQVLMEMEQSTAANAPSEFARASKAVLTRRVKNSPPARNEKQWLPGWLNRCDTYSR